MSEELGIVRLAAVVVVIAGMIICSALLVASVTRQPEPVPYDYICSKLPEQNSWTAITPDVVSTVDSLSLFPERDATLCRAVKSR